MKHNRQQQQMAEEAMIQTSNVTEPAPTTQDNKPLETPVQPEPKEPVQPVRSSKQIQDQLPGNYFQQSTTAVNIRGEAQYQIL